VKHYGLKEMPLPRLAGLRWTRISILLVLLLSAGMRLHDVTQPLVDAFGWREASTAMMAENLPKNHWNPLWPEVSWTGDQPGYQGREFQTLTLATELLNNVLGTRDWHGRLIAVLFGLLTTFALYRLVATLRNPREGIAAAAIYALSPGAVMTDRSYLPDPAMVGLLATALWCLAEGLKTGSRARLTFAAILGILAILAKPIAAITIPAAIYLIVQLPHREGRSRRLQFFGIWLGATAGVAGSYFAWAIHLGRTYPPFHIAGSWTTPWALQAAELFYIGHFNYLALSWLWTPFILFLAVLGVIRFVGSPPGSPVARAPLLFPIWLFCCVLLYLCISRELVDNPWNFHIADPGLAALAGAGLLTATGLDRDCVNPARHAWRAAVVFVMLLPGSRTNLNNMKWGYTYFTDLNMGKALLLVSDPKGLVVASGKDAGNPLAIYYSRRKGWIFPPPPGDFTMYDMEPSEAVHQLSEMRRHGARWFALAMDAHDIAGRKFADRYPEVISFLDRQGSVIDGTDFKIYALPSIEP
jgi:hypothetical protein